MQDIQDKDTSTGEVQRTRQKKKPVEARFCTLVQTDPETHQACCTMGTGSVSRGVKRPGRGVKNPPPCSAEVKETAELNLYSSSRPSWPVLG
jgi:hypothetical protein